MDNNAIREYKTLVTDTIQKQITIFGLPMALIKLRQIPGLKVADDGTVLSMPADPRTIMRPLVEQFNRISPSVVKKTMKPLILLTESIADLKKEEEKETAAPPNTELTESTRSQDAKTTPTTPPTQDKQPENTQTPTSPPMKKEVN